MHNKLESTVDVPGPRDGDHGGGDDVREPPQDAPRSDELPATEDDVDPEDGGGRIEKQA